MAFELFMRVALREDFPQYKRPLAKVKRYPPQSPLTNLIISHMFLYNFWGEGETGRRGDGETGGVISRDFLPYTY